MIFQGALLAGALLTIAGLNVATDGLHQLNINRNTDDIDDLLFKVQALEASLTSKSNSIKLF